MTNFTQKKIEEFRDMERDNGWRFTYKEQIEAFLVDSLTSQEQELRERIKKERDTYNKNSETGEGWGYTALDDLLFSLDQPQTKE